MKHYLALDKDKDIANSKDSKENGIKYLILC
jgi:hypothetical protein